jgi:hypothetical protein
MIRDSVGCRLTEKNSGVVNGKITFAYQEMFRAALHASLPHSTKVRAGQDYGARQV